MAVITISRQYASGGTEIAIRIGEMLGYRYFDKKLMAQVASEAILSQSEIVDFSEDTYKVQTLWDRLFVNWLGPRVVAQVGTWKETSTGAQVEEVAKLDEAQSITVVQSALRAAYRNGNVVIVGRGGQAVLKEVPGVLKVRIEAPLDARVQRLQEQENLSLKAAQSTVLERDEAIAEYLGRFYNIDGDDPMLYDLVINTHHLNLEAAAHLIVNAVSYLPPVEMSNQGQIS